MRDDIVGASFRIEAGKTARPVEDGEPAVGILVHAHGGADVVMAMALGGIWRLRRLKETQLSAPTTRSSWTHSTSSIGRPT